MAELAQQLLKPVERDAPSHSQDCLDLGEDRVLLLLRELNAPRGTVHHPPQHLLLHLPQAFIFV